MNNRQLSSEDITYVKLHLLLPLILSAFARDKKIAESVFKTPAPYLALMESAMRKVDADLFEIRRKFRELGLKVYEESRTEKGIEAKYLCRGYHHQISLQWSFAAAESTILMEKYLGMDIFKYIDPSVPERSVRDYNLAIKQEKNPK
ncbi:hypothetical protein J2Z69_000794 [Paenibacillus shirakamiensis]|uniref:Uncharacterized protein n=1 Tax=Paenibacillus shirakamiensis TaxID=1265935 RepID=A0ABS4JDG8_9BACL|nr:hypothetical protein [Paenibacillus shirakamiensis]MBP1999775.1 hypothetical protein [Paenibacillus shirakamiensis]